MLTALKYRIFIIVTASASLCLMSGCGSSDSPPPTTVASTSTSAGSPAQAVSAPQSSSPDDASSEETEKPQASYGGEESSQSQGGGFDGSGPDSEDDDGSGGFGFGGGDSGGGGPSRSSVGSFGNSSGGGQQGLAGGSGPRGPSRAGMAGPSTGQFGGGRSGGNPDDEDFGLDGPGTSGIGPGGFGGADANNANLATGFLRQYCVSCHSANDPKGDLRLDVLKDDILADSKSWKSVADVVEDGSMPPNQARQPEQALRVQIVSFIRDNLGATAEASYLEQAESAFKKGDEGEALKLFYSHVLTVEDAQAAELLDNMRLYRPKVSKPEDLVASNDYTASVKPALKTQLKLAVGIILKADENVTEVKPIGSSQAGGLGGGDSGGAGGFGRGLGQDGTGQAEDNNKLTTFEDLTGDYGKALVKAFQTRRDEGKFGTLFASVRLPSASSKAGAGGAGLGGGTDLEDSGGLRGLSAGRLGGDGFDEGGLGMGGMGLGANESSLQSKTQPDQPLANGLTYLGKGKINELFKKAVELGADGIFLFDINSSKNNRTNLVSTDTRLRFLLISGKVVATASKFLNNREIERLTAQKKETDEVQKQVDQIFNRIDQVLVLESIPKMSESAALKHIHGLVHSDAPPLQVMAQARLFHSKGIISAEQLAMVYQIVLEGNEGIALASGTEADRKLVLETVMSRL